MVMKGIDINAVEIVPIAEGHIEGFHRTLDIVARERRYLAFLEAPPLPSTRTFILNMIGQGYPQFVAMADDEVAGWCDIIPNTRPNEAHAGVARHGPFAAVPRGRPRQASHPSNARRRPRLRPDPRRTF